MCLLLFWLLACTERWESWEQDGWPGATAEKTSNARGRAVFHAPVAEGATHFLFTTSTDYPYRTYVETVEDADGNLVFDANDWWEEPRGLTGALSPKGATSLNWPILDDDPPPAGDWRIEVGVIDAESVFTRNVPVVADVIAKEDLTPEGGAVVANLVLTGGLAEDDELLAALDGAVRHWRDLYAAAGISLTVEAWTWPNDQLRAPGSGTREDWIAISEAMPLGGVNVVLLPEVVGQPGIFGIAGGIPGPLVPSAHSAVAIATDVNAGPDGGFSPEEERLFGETLAHEVGHYLGLFHPVESTWDAWDALEDTVECQSELGCFDTLGENLMFPFPICTASACVPQGELTPEQEALANRYTGVE